MSAKNIRSFIPLQKLGQGSFASVYKVKRLSDQKIYALKKIKMNQLPQKARQNSLNQVRFLASFDSPYITKYYEAFFDQNLDVLCIVMEYAQSGDLRKLVNKHKKQKRLITQIQIWKVMIHLIFGLKILHDSQIMHRDIKCENIFISDGKYKIGDMNVSKIYKQGFLETQTGTPYYACPQVWKDEPYNQKSDIWSLGCILYEMATLRPPFLGSSMQDLYKNILKGSYPCIPKCYSNQLGSIIDRCLKVNPLKRPLTSDLLADPTIKIYQNLCMQTKIPKDKIIVQMLQTICLPKNIKQLNKCLPKSNYQSQNFTSPLKDFTEIIKQQNKIGVINNFIIKQINEENKINEQQLNLKSNQINNIQQQNKIQKQIQIKQQKRSLQPLSQRLFISKQLKPSKNNEFLQQIKKQQFKIIKQYKNQNNIEQILNKIKSYSKNQDSTKKKRRILKQIQKNPIIHRSRSKSLPRTQKSINRSKQLYLGDLKNIQIKNHQQNYKNSPKKIQIRQNRRYFHIIEEAKKYLQRSLSKKRIY